MNATKDIEMKDATDDSTPSLKPPENSPNAQTATEPAMHDNISPDTPQFKPRFLLSGHKRAVSCLKFSPDGTYLASSCTPDLPHDLTASYH